jgi:hypothetical protein
MQPIKTLFLFIFLFIIASGCSTSTKIIAFQPEPDDAEPLLFEKSPSFINLPISIKLKDVENKTNSLLNGLIYNDTIIEDDNLEIKIWKQAPISLNNNSVEPIGKLTTILPLKAIVKYRVGTKRLGISIYTIKEFHLNGVVHLESEVNLVNWKLNTTTRLQSLEWKESPTILLFGKNIPITYIINSSTSLFKSKIERKIDESIAKSMDFKPNVLDALDKISAPFEINKQYKSWLRLTPLEIYATNAVIKGQTIFLEMGMKCYLESLIGKQPETKFNSDAIQLKPVEKIPNRFNANITAVSNYQEASEIITKNFVGQEFGSGKKKIKVLNVALWHKKGKIVIALDIRGSINGTIYLTGIPKFNESTKEIYFEQMDYALDTKNKLLKTANWLAQNYIISKIQSNCKYSIQSNLDEGNKSIKTYLKNYSPMPGVFVNGKIEDIQFKKIQLTNQAIIAFLNLQGMINITIDGLK